MRKRILSIILVSVLTLSLIGCGKSDGTLESMSKKELIEKYNALNSQYNTLWEEKDAIEKMYNALNVDNTPVAAIGYVGDGSGELTFNSKDAKIIFPTTFQYPNAENVVATNQIKITDRVYFSPGSNWIVKLSGTTVEVEHSNGISGLIKVGKSDTRFTSEELRETAIGPWFDGISTHNITYSDLFASEAANAIGVDATVPINIDSEDAFLRCGMCCYGETALTYVFVYRSTQDVNRDESIINVLESIHIGNSSLVVNQ